MVTSRKQIISSLSSHPSCCLILLFLLSAEGSIFLLGTSLLVCLWKLAPQIKYNSRYYVSAPFPISDSPFCYQLLTTLLSIVYEFLSTAIGQAIAVYSPNVYFAALANPIFRGSRLINSCGIVVLYDQIKPFWRYWHTTWIPSPIWSLLCPSQFFGTSRLFVRLQK